MSRKKRNAPKKTYPKNSHPKNSHPKNRSSKRKGGRHPGEGRSPKNTQRDMRREMQQNFLRHEHVAERIVDGAGIRSGDLVVEFGAGAGMLTRPLSKKAGRVLAVEFDPHWASLLEERFAENENIEIVRGDALTVKLPDEPYRVVANVPFYITTEILHRLLDDPRSSPESAHLLVQKAVAAKHARHSPTTLKTLAWSPWYEFSAPMRVPSESFHPVPDVDGGVLAAVRRREELVPARRKECFREFTRHMFTGRGRSVGERMRRVFTKKQIWRLAKDVGFERGSEPSMLTVRQWAKVFAFAERK